MLDSLWKRFQALVFVAGILTFLLALVVIGLPWVLMDYFDFYEDKSLLVCHTLGFAFIANLLTRGVWRHSIQVYQSEERISEEINRCASRN